MTERDHNVDLDHYHAVHQYGLLCHAVRCGILDATDERESLQFQHQAEAHLLQSIKQLVRLTRRHF